MPGFGTFAAVSGHSRDSNPFDERQLIFPQTPYATQLVLMRQVGRELALRR